VDIFLLVMAGAFLGFPLGYYIDQWKNVEIVDELGPDRPAAKLN